MTMTTGLSREALERLAAHVASQGFVLTMSTKRLFMFRVPDAAPQQLVVATEGGGCLIYDGKRPLSSFALLSCGFDVEVAATLAETINEVYALLRDKHPDQTSTSSAPEGASLIDIDPADPSDPDNP